MTRSFYTDTVVRQRATTVDDGHGNLVEDWTAPNELSIPGCRVQPLSSEEILLHREAGLEVTRRLLAPFGSDVLASDRVVFGDTYEVGGEPSGFRSPSGVAAHDEILLRRFDG